MAAESTAQSPGLLDTGGQPGRLWLLRLVPDVRGGRWLTSAVIFACLIVLFAAAGSFGTPAHPAQGSPGVMLFFAVSLAYIVPVYHYISERSVMACRALQTLLPGEHGKLAAKRVEHKPGRWFAVVLSLAISTGIAHNWLLWPDEMTTLDLLTDAPTVGATMLATSLIWFVMTFAVAGLVDNAFLFRRLAREVNIDLLNTRSLIPFASVAVSSTLAIIGAQAAFSIMFIGGPIDLRAVVPGLVATGGPLLVLFLVPIWPVHHRLTELKRRELDRLSQHISRIPRPIAEDPQALASVAQLLGYRREIAALSEWPFSTGTLGRLALYLIIPPLSWIGAALIEIALDAAL